MSQRRLPAASVPAAGRRLQPLHGTQSGSAAASDGCSAPGPEQGRAGASVPRRGFFADTSADFDGRATDELVRTVGLLVGACGSESQLAVLAKQLAGHVERRDAHVAIAQLQWRLSVLEGLHQEARGDGARRGR